MTAPVDGSAAPDDKTLALVAGLIAVGTPVLKWIDAGGGLRVYRVKTHDGHHVDIQQMLYNWRLWCIADEPLWWPGRFWPRLAGTSHPTRSRAAGTRTARPVSGASRARCADLGRVSILHRRESQPRLTNLRGLRASVLWPTVTPEGMRETRAFSDLRKLHLDRLEELGEDGAHAALKKELATMSHEKLVELLAGAMHWVTAG